MSSASSQSKKQPGAKPTSTSGRSETDWERVDALSDAQIDLTDNPELTAEMFARAVLREGLAVRTPKCQVTLRLDADVLDWFRGSGPGYQTRINALLRAYVDAHRSR